MNSEEIGELRQQLALMDEMIKSQETLLIINSKTINEYKQNINNIFKVSSENLVNVKSNQESMTNIESKITELEHNLNTKANNDELNKLFQMIMETQKQAIEKMCLYESKLSNSKQDPVVTENEMIIIRNEIKKIDKISNQCTEIKDIINGMDIEKIKTDIQSHSKLLTERTNSEAIEYAKSEIEKVWLKIEEITKYKPVVLQQITSPPKSSLQQLTILQKEVEDIKLSLNVFKEGFNNSLNFKNINNNDILTIEERLKESIENLTKLKEKMEILQQNNNLLEIQGKKNSEDCSNLFNLLSKNSKELPQVTVVRDQSSVSNEIIARMENKINTNFNTLSLEFEKLGQEVNKLKKLIKEIPETSEDKIEKFSKEQKSDVNTNFPSNIKELLEKELEAIKAKIQQNEDSNTKLIVMVTELESNLLKKISENQGTQEKGVNVDEVNNLRNEIKALIESLLIGIQKKFADSNETRNALKLLEKQIKYLFRRKEKKLGGSGVMFSKKQLLPWSCASCAKDLVNIESKVAKYYNWNKMPAREINARLKSMVKTFSGENVEVNYNPVKKSLFKLKFHEGADIDKAAKLKNIEFNVEGEYSQRASTALFASPNQFLKKTIPLVNPNKPN